MPNPQGLAQVQGRFSSLLGQGPSQMAGQAGMPSGALGPGGIWDSLPEMEKMRQEQLTLAVGANQITADQAYKMGWLGPDAKSSTPIAPTPASQSLLK
jgi:hypothetical protein